MVQLKPVAAFAAALPAAFDDDRCGIGDEQGSLASDEPGW